MITKDTHKVDWNKTAQVTGVVLLALVKAVWWLTKHAGLLLIATLTVLAKVFVALVSVWAVTPDSKPVGDFQQADDFEPGIDSNGEIAYTGVRRKINY